VQACAARAASVGHTVTVSSMLATAVECVAAGSSNTSVVFSGMALVARKDTTSRYPCPAALLLENWNAGPGTVQADESVRTSTPEDTSHTGTDWNGGVVNAIPSFGVEGSVFSIQCLGLDVLGWWLWGQGVGCGFRVQGRGFGVKN